MKSIYNFFSNLPSIAWVFLLPLGLILFIGSIILFFVSLATIEGFASLIFLVLGILYIKGSTTDVIINSSKIQEKSSGFFLACGICFFALMGVAIDQPGNYFYNKPLEIFFCPNDSKLLREESVSHPLPGRTDITQNFACVDSNKKVVDNIGIGHVILIRFVEYVALGYLIIGISNFLKQKKLNKSQSGAVTKS